MFDAIFNSLAAFNQVAMIFAGLLFAGIGGLMIVAPLADQMKRVRVKGRIVGVVSERKPDGESTPVSDVPEKVEPDESFGEFFVKSPGKGLLALLFVSMFFGIPLLFVGFGTYFAWNYADLKMRGTAAEAMVVRVESYTDSDSGTTYAPVLSYRDSNGFTQESRDRISSSGGDRFEPGQKLPIYYDPDKPDRFIIDEFWHNMLMPIVFAGMGGAFLVLLLAGVFNKNKKPDPGTKDKPPTRGTEIYHPVYEYTAPDGTIMQSHGDTGSSFLGDKIPGTRLTLLLKADDYTAVTTPGYLLSFFGLLFFAPGAFILHMAVTSFDFNIYTIIVGLAGLVMIGLKIKKGIKPKSEWDTRASFRDRMKQKRAAKQKNRHLLDGAELRARLRAEDRMMRIWLSIYALVSVAMIAGGTYWAQTQTAFERAAIAVEGEVIRMVEQSSDDGYTYYPVIRFTTQEGRDIEFKDRVGSSHPTLDRGDRVDVLYDAGQPKDAIIDRGIWNLAPAIAIFILGFVFLGRLLKSMADLSRRAGRY